MVPSPTEWHGALGYVRRGRSTHARAERLMRCLRWCRLRFQWHSCWIRRLNEKDTPEECHCLPAWSYARGTHLFAVVLLVWYSNTRSGCVHGSVRCLCLYCCKTSVKVSSGVAPACVICCVMPTAPITHCDHESFPFAETVSAHRSRGFVAKTLTYSNERNWSVVQNAYKLPCATSWRSYALLIQQHSI